MSVNNVAQTSVRLDAEQNSAAELEAEADEALGLELNSQTEGGDSFSSTTAAAANSNETNGKMQLTQTEYQAYKTQLEAKQNILDSTEALLEPQEKKLEELKKQYEENKEEYDKITAKIEEATKDAQEAQKQEQQDAIYSAMASYNAEKDGDYEEYMANALSGVLSADSAAGLSSFLASQKSDLLVELGSLESQISSTTKLVDKYKTTINTTTTEIQRIQNVLNNSEVIGGYMDDEKYAGMTPSEIAFARLKDQNIVGEAELSFIESLGEKIDLTEKLQNGNPRYVVALGKQDGEYHVYEVSEDGQRYSSLVRQFAPNQGFDIIKSGNGYMNVNSIDFDTPGEDSSVFYFQDSGEIQSVTACYETCSPLSFDINGDGVQTSDEIIEYDIDGDGVLDKINDSADAVLTFDKDGDGISGEDGSECFGNNTDLDGDGVADGHKDGFAALKAFAKENGLINGVDDNVLDENDIKYLEEKFGFKMKLGGYNSEATSLLDAGITEINLADTDETTLTKDYDGKQNDIMTQEGATFTVNGEEREYADIWHSKKD